MNALFRRLQYVVIIVIFLGCTSTQFTGSNNSGNKKGNSSNNNGQLLPQSQNQINAPYIEAVNTSTNTQTGMITEGNDKLNGNLNGGGDKIDPNSIPGTPMTVFGIEFEDWTDFDYDIGFCFEGAFKVNGNSIVSYKDQIVTGRPAEISYSACDHTVDVTITRVNGTIDTQSYPSKTTPSIQMTFKIGDKLDVTLTPISGDLCRDAGTLNTKIGLGNIRARMNMDACY